MRSKVMALCLAVFLGPVASGAGKPEAPDRVAGEQVLARFAGSSLIAASFKVSPDGRRAAYVTQSGGRQVVHVDGTASEPHGAVVAGTPLFSRTANGSPTARRPATDGPLSSTAGATAPTRAS